MALAPARRVTDAMLLIPCPHCGPRAQTEFSYGGDASVVRPNLEAEVNCATQAQEKLHDMAAHQWLDHIYLRDNPRGSHLEWWQHSSGCRAWIKVRRDTATHQILGASQATQSVAPEPGTEPHSKDFDE
jgi:heterotetrameric sarcosine oxidase delta subunit